VWAGRRAGEWIWRGVDELALEEVVGIDWMRVFLHDGLVCSAQTRFSGLVKISWLKPVRCRTPSA
jgi:hypothetical protein